MRKQMPPLPLPKAIPSKLRAGYKSKQKTLKKFKLLLDQKLAEAAMHHDHALLVLFDEVPQL